MLTNLIPGLLILAAISIPQASNVNIAKQKINLPEWENSQTFIAEDNTPHTVYWAKGLNMPQVSQDDFITTTAGGEDYYGYFKEYDPAHGYYDLNKRQANYGRPHGDETNMCYLGSSSNALHWWFDQNEPYIKEYISHIEADDGFFQYDKDLYPLQPYDANLWNNIIYGEVPFEKPGPDYKYKGQEIATDPIIQGLMQHNYYDRDNGFWMDRVIDYVLNGYFALGNEGFPNQESDFPNLKDSTGGLLNPIFNERKTTQRHKQITTYDAFNENIVKFIMEGKIIMFGITTTSIDKGHAITIWGGELDENGNLYRLYYTDTDDFDEISPNGILYGMRSYYTKKYTGDRSGLVLLDGRVGPMETAKKTGATIYDFITFDLSTDMIIAALNENKDIAAPTSQTSGNVEYIVGARPAPISVNITNQNSGTYRYQWYQKVNNGIDKKLEGETKSTYTPKADVIGKNTYYCEITNWVNGKTNVAKSSDIEVSVIDGVIIHAKEPVVTFNRISKIYNGFKDVPANVKISAYSLDGGQLSYQWYRSETTTLSDRVKLVGETNPTLELSKYIKPYDNYFFCEVTNYLASANGDKYATWKVTNKTRVHDIYVNIDGNVLSELEKYANMFINTNVCGTNDNTSASLTLFNQMKDKYQNLSPNAKEILKDYNSNQYSSDVIAKMLAKYDRIIYKHAGEGFDDFMTRRLSPNFGFKIDLERDNRLNDNMVVIYTIAGIIAIVSVSMLVFISFKRKRKSK